MADEATVLGLACRAADDRLSAWFVAVRRNADDTVDVLELEPWHATSGTDEAAQLADVQDAITNTIDARRLGDLTAVAVKRVEMPVGRPPKPYDRKVRFEAAAMLAANATGKRYFAYRKQELKSRSDLMQAAQAADGSPTATEAVEAMAAACAALSDLG